MSVTYFNRRSGYNDLVKPFLRGAIMGNGVVISQDGVDLDTITADVKYFIWNNQTGGNVSWTTSLPRLHNNPAWRNKEIYLINSGRWGSQNLITLTVNTPQNDANTNGDPSRIVGGIVSTPGNSSNIKTFVITGGNAVVMYSYLFIDTGNRRKWCWQTLVSSSPSTGT